MDTSSCVCWAGQHQLGIQIPECGVSTLQLLQLPRGALPVQRLQLQMETAKLSLRIPPYPDFWVVLGTIRNLCPHRRGGIQLRGIWADGFMSTESRKSRGMLLSFQAFPGPDLPVSSRAFPKKHSFY